MTLNSKSQAAIAFGCL